jgi:VWFA-related protein
MNARPVALAAAIVAAVGLVPAAQQPTFRVAVDLIPVDVQVIDDAGQPVPGLTASQFEVIVNGRRRRVASATFIDNRAAARAANGAEGAAPGAVTDSAGVRVAPDAGSAGASGADLPLRRIFVLAVDASSFDESTGRPVIEAARDFIKGLSPVDELGLFTFPIGPKVDPTTDHDAVLRSLDAIIARRETPPEGTFPLSPGDLVELSRTPPTPMAERLVERLCGPPPLDEQCVGLLSTQVNAETLFYEGAAQASIGMLQGLMLELGKSAERKVVVLLSGGMMSSDLPGARPDLRLLGFEAGRTAARANVSVYSLFLDQAWMRQNSAETRRAQVTSNASRDSAIVGRWLEEFSGAAAGSFVRVTAGNGSGAFRRVLAETSAYYLLGVEPAPAERDGRPYQLRVRVNVPNVSVRGRSWVIVPKPGTPPERAETPIPVAAAPPAPAERPPALPPTPPEVRALSEAFDRDDRASIEKAFQPRGADALIDAFRSSESPWPSSPKRTAAFALDLAVAGLRSSSPFVQNASGRLLGEYAIRVRQPVENDPFECAWFWTATAAILGLYNTEAGTVFAERGVERCPADPNLRLALAVALDQQWSNSRLDGGGGWGLTAAAAIEERLLAAYEAASQSPATRYEAQVRAAFVHYRLGRFAEGLALTETPIGPGDDAQIRYLGQLVRGLLLGRVGRSDDALVALREALVMWPGAQSARVALSNLLVARGEFDEAARLAEMVLASPPAQQDPWWLYYLGDFRGYSAVRARLREVAR